MQSWSFSGSRSRAGGGGGGGSGRMRDRGGLSCLRGNRIKTRKEGQSFPTEGILYHMILAK